MKKGKQRTCTGGGSVTAFSFKRQDDSPACECLLPLWRYQSKLKQKRPVILPEILQEDEKRQREADRKSVPGNKNSRQDATIGFSSKSASKQLTTVQTFVTLT
jgi:hypothetical protein